MSTYLLQSLVLKVQQILLEFLKKTGNESDDKELMDEGDTSNAIPYIPKDKSKLH